MESTFPCQFPFINRQVGAGMKGGFLVAVSPNLLALTGVNTGLLVVAKSNKIADAPTDIAGRERL
jgi:hypothetical protein